jgi:GT2 family glycosyltransferase
MSGSDPADLTAVVVGWNSGDALLGALRSLAEHPPAVAWEAVLVDNHSADGSADRVAAELPWVRVIRNATNRGLASANNQGIEASAGPWVLICNPDIVVGPGALDALLGVMDRHPRAAFAVAKLVRPDGSLQTSAGDLPTLAEALLGRLVQQRLGRARTDDSAPHGFWWDGWAHDEERPIGHGMEACFLVRRAALADIGLQDEGFPLDWEGIDWSARAAAAGWEVWFCPAAEVVHLGGVSLRQAQAAWVVRSHRGMYRYFAKRRSAAWRPLLAVAFAGRAALKLVGLRLHLADYRASHPGAAEHP